MAQSGPARSTRFTFTGLAAGERALAGAQVWPAGQGGAETVCGTGADSIAAGPEAGRVSVMRSPCGSFRLAWAVPLWVVATALTMASPRPDPGGQPRPGPLR